MLAGGRYAAVFLTLFLTASLSAQTQRIVLYPPQPYSDHPVEVGVPFDCVLTAPTVERRGAIINITLESAGICDPPLLVEERVLIPGLLPRGTYEVRVWQPRQEQPYATLSFEVRDRSQALFHVHPPAVPAGPTLAPLRIRLSPGVESPLCPGGNCNVRVGTTFVEKQVDAEGNVWINAPALEEGFHDVVIEKTQYVVAMPAALYAFDRAKPPLASMWERVLFPVLFSARGAHGSEWRSDAVISNPNHWYVETFNNVRPLACPAAVGIPCGERLHPGEYHKFIGALHPQGAALLVPRSEARLLSFALRVRDVSREAESYGTEVPVAREAEMQRGAALLTLPRVPLDARYRIKVRIYAMDVPRGEPLTARVHWGLTPVDGRESVTMQVPLNTNCDDETCSTDPAYAELNLPSNIAPGHQNLFISLDAGDGLAWAFATVTNNDTQQVTVVTPGGGGAVPFTGGAR